LCLVIATLSRRDRLARASPMSPRLRVQGLASLAMAWWPPSPLGPVQVYGRARGVRKGVGRTRSPGSTMLLQRPAVDGRAEAAVGPVTSPTGRIRRMSEAPVLTDLPQTTVVGIRVTAPFEELFTAVPSAWREVFARADELGE